MLQAGGTYFLATTMLRGSQRQQPAPSGLLKGVDWGLRACGILERHD